MCNPVSGNCLLCALPVKEGPFCCVGCRIVFEILQSQNVGENFKNHPLYKQALQSKIIANPLLLEEMQKKEADIEEEKITFLVENMWCPSCAEAIRLILLRHKGVISCSVDYTTDLATLVFSPRRVSKETLFNLIKKLGYIPKDLFEEEKKRKGFALWGRFAVATFASSNIMMLSYPLYLSFFRVTLEGFEKSLGFLSFAFALPLLFYSGSFLFRRFYLSLKVRRFGMESLVLLSTTTAFFYSTSNLLKGKYDALYFDSMSMVIVLVLLGKILANRAKISIKESLFSTLFTFTKKARIRNSQGHFVFVSLKELKVGDIFYLFEGEKVSLDGEIIEGIGILDTSLMTGEALPLEKKVGDLLTGGMLLVKGHLLIKVTAPFEKSYLVKLLENVGSTLHGKKSYFPLTDRIVQFFVPAVILLSLFSKNIDQFCSVLLIACPCSIGIAAPLTLAFIMQKLSCKGVIIRNMAALAHLTKPLTFVFDKTGTLTNGNFTLLHDLDHLSIKERSILKTLASYSTHPVAYPIVQKITEPIICVDNLEQILGKGVKGKFENKTYYLGAFLLPSSNTYEQCLVTTVYFGEEGGKACYKLELTDPLRDKIKENIAPFNAVLLSGDNPQNVKKVAELLDIKESYGSCDPFKKKEIIESLKKQKTVVMVGDGANDALPLATADVGVSFANGSELAKCAADILLTRPDFTLLSETITLAKKGKNIILQNLIFSFLYNGIGIGLAMADRLTPFFAALAMAASSLFVTLNALRIKRIS